MPVGNVPYHHRRKYSPQVPPDYQSRIFFGDYMRENRPSRVAGGSGHVGTSTVAAPAAAGTQLSNSGASSGEEQQYSSSAASSVAQDNAGSVNNFPSGLQQQHNGNGPTSPVSGSQISLGQQQRVTNNNNNIAVIGGLAGSGSLSTATVSGNNCCAGSGGTAGVAGCDSNGNDDGCAELQFHHQSSPGE
ncbi:hypothetical protein pipiens_003126 [Culex pipiens pipiens]|uniref:Uncharacterized protein n=2 Tax=Culex pipiens TaxID=7175 RepID=A0ABD1D3K4_CULPP